MAQRAILLRQHRRRRVVAHGRQRFFAILGHRRKDLLKLFDAVTRGHLTAPQFVSGKDGLLRYASQRFVEIADFLDPFAKGLARGQLVLDLGVVKQRAFLHVHSQQLPGAQRALLDHVSFIERNHPRFGASD